MVERKRLEPGMLIKTNYSSEPYRIVEVERGCTCPFYLDEIDLDEPPAQPEHIHLTLTRPDGTGRFWMGHYVEETLLSLDKTYCGLKDKPDHDRIIILEQDKPIQKTLF